jgi:hypothetical protein
VEESEHVIKQKWNLFNEHDESVAASLQFHGCPGLDEPVKSERGLLLTERTILRTNKMI